MKRLLIMLAVLSSTSLCSCKKDNRCYCLDAAGNHREYNLHTTKKKAAEMCDTYETDGFSCEITDYQ